MGQRARHSSAMRSRFLFAWPFHFDQCTEGTYSGIHRPIDQTLGCEVGFNRNRNRVQRDIHLDGGGFVDEETAGRERSQQQIHRVAFFVGSTQRRHRIDHKVIATGADNGSTILNQHRPWRMRSPVERLPPARQRLPAHAPAKAVDRGSEQQQRSETDGYFFISGVPFVH